MKRAKQPTHLDLMAFAVAVETSLAARALVRADIARMGRALAAEVYGPRGVMTLREAARRSGLSAGYLSAVANGRSVISPAAYVRVAELVREQ